MPDSCAETTVQCDHYRWCARSFPPLSPETQRQSADWRFRSMHPRRQSLLLRSLRQKYFTQRLIRHALIMCWCPEARGLCLDLGIFIFSARGARTVSSDPSWQTSCTPLSIRRVCTRVCSNMHGSLGGPVGAESGLTTVGLDGTRTGGRHMDWSAGNGMVMLIVWTLVVVALAYWFLRITNKNSEVTTPQDSALSILRERYARGEISKEEYENRRRHLAP